MGGDVVHVHVGGIAQGQELDDGPHDQGRDHLLVLAELQELLDDDAPEGVHHASFRVRRA